MSPLTALRLASLEDEWTAEIRRRMKPTVWQTGGCASWYLDKFGNNTTLWPGQTFTFRQHLSKFDLDRYDVEVSHQREAVSA